MRINSTRPILFAALFACALTSTAQTTGEQIAAKPRLTYMNVFNSGALVGNKSAGTAFSFSTIHGVRRGRFAGGAGIGYDGYDRWKVVPVTGSVSYDFARIKNNAFFVQVNGGAAIDAWRPDTENYVGGPSYDFTSGRTFSSLAGYRITTGKFSMYVSAGYKYQRLNYHMESYYYWTWIDQGLSSTYIPPSFSVKETMERLVVQIGIGLH